MHIKVVKAFHNEGVPMYKNYDIGAIVTDLQDLLDNTSIIVPSDVTPILVVHYPDDSISQYLFKDITNDFGVVNEYIIGNGYTIDDLILITEDGVPTTYIAVVTTYSDLPDPTTVPNTFYYVNESQGTQWLPGSLGGSYFPNGVYYSNGITWSYVKTPYQATQIEVDAGLNTDKFVTPLTFESAIKWNTTLDLANDYADSLISQTITNGITNKTPSEDAVFDALALKYDISNPSGYISNANLAFITSPTNGTITSDVGTDAIIPTVDFTNAGLLAPEEKQLLYNDSSTGVTRFDGFTINVDATKYNVGIVEGWFVDNHSTPTTPTKIFKTFPASLANTLPDIATQNVTYVAIDINGVLQLSGTPFLSEQQRDWIPLGVIIHSNRVNVNAINNQPVVTFSPLNQLSDLMESIGVFNIEGNVISPNGANLNINKSAGSIFKQGVNFINDNKDPHTLNLAALLAPTNIRYRTQIGTEFANTNIIDTGFYDLAGVRTAIPGTRYSIQRIYLFQSNLIRIQYGQATYITQTEAIQAISTEAFVVEQNILENGLFRGLLIVREGTTDLTDISRALFIEASKFGSVAGLGSLSTTSLQQAYKNSLNPEITTDSILGSVDIIRGSAADTDNVFRVLNGAGTGTFVVTGKGDVSLSNGTDTFNISQATIAGQTGQPFIKSNKGYYVFQPSNVSTAPRFYLIPSTGVSGTSSKFELFNTNYIADGANYNGLNVITNNINNDIQFGANRLGTAPRLKMVFGGDYVGSALTATSSRLEFFTNDSLGLNTNGGAITFGANTTDPFSFSIANQYTFKNPTLDQATRLNLVGNGTAAGVLAYGTGSIRNVATSVIGGTSDYVIALNTTNSGTTLTDKFRIFSADGNVLIQNGGAFVNNGYRLDINGTTRLQSTVTLGTTPTTSAGTYDFLTRNTSTGIIEKVLSSSLALDASVVHIAGTETITGTKTFSNNLTSQATIFASSNFNSSTTNIILSDTSGVAFRAVRANAWSDNISTRFFQIGTFSDNIAFTTQGGNASNRALYSSLQTQFTSGNYIAHPTPVGIFEITNGTTRFFNIFSTGNVTINSGTDAGYRLDVTGTTRLNGQTTIQGTTASDTAPLGAELTTTGSGTNWTGTSFALGYTHTVGSTVALTSALAAIVNNFYQISYTITGRTAGSVTIAFGGDSNSGITATGARGPKATTTGTLSITPTTDFDGTIVLSIKVLTASTAAVTLLNSSGVTVGEIRANSSNTNTSIGVTAGRNISTGVQNTNTGVNAGRDVTTGQQNTSSGYDAGSSTTTGIQNTNIGVSAGLTNTSGSFNTNIGTDSGRANTIGMQNTNLGVSAGQNNTTGGSNTNLGVNAGRFFNLTSLLTNASSSIFVGHTSRALADNGTNEIVIGTSVTGLGSNTTSIGNSSTVTSAIYGNLLLGTTTVTGAKLTVSGSINAASGFARGVFVTPSLVATGNNQELIGLNISPTYTNGAFTGVANYDLKLTSTIRFDSPNWTVGDGSSNILHNAGLKLTSISAGSHISLRGVGSVTYAQLFNNNGNFLLQNGGTFTDAGYRLDVNGTARLQSTVTLGTAPTTSAGGYDIITRNTSTGVVEKVPSNSFLVGTLTKGTATLVAGTVTVNTSAALTGSIIIVSLNTPGGTLGIAYATPSASIVNATSFVINSVSAAGVLVATDTSTINWQIIN